MANLAGYDMASVGNMVNHYTRHADDPDQGKYTYRNQQIDRDRTRLNYTLYERPEGAQLFIQNRVAGVDVMPKLGGGKPTNILSDWIITMPRNERLAGREREFFETAFSFVRRQVGGENIVGAYVHMDETTPHVHIAFTPVTSSPVMTNDKTRPLRWTKADEHRDKTHKAGAIKRDRNGTPRYERVPKLDTDGNVIMRTSFAQSKIYDRQALRDFHPDLERALADHFGFEVGIQLTNPGERQLSKLGHEEYKAARETLRVTGEKVEKLAMANEQLTPIVTKRQAELESVTRELGQAEVDLEAAHMDLAGLEAEIQDAHAKSTVLRGSIDKNRQLAASLDRSIEEKTARLESVQGRLERFSERRDEAAGRVDDLARLVEATRGVRADAPGGAGTVEGGGWSAAAGRLGAAYKRLADRAAAALRGLEGKARALISSLFPISRGLVRNKREWKDRRAMQAGRLRALGELGIASEDERLELVFAERDVAARRPAPARDAGAAIVDVARRDDAAVDGREIERGRGAR